VNLKLILERLLEEMLLLYIEKEPKLRTSSVVLKSVKAEIIWS
jgi:hypothetical protein